MESIPLVTDEEFRLIVLALGTARGPGGSFSEEEAAVVIDWAERVRQEALCLKMILDGQILIDVRDGDVVFKAKKP